MNDFNITVKSEPFYAQDHYGAPVVIFDDIKLEQKTVSTQIDAQAPMHVLKDVAAQQLAKKIVDSMNHTSISNKIENTYYDIFSFTYAPKDQLDILEQQLGTRTKQYLSQAELNNDNQKKIVNLIDKNIQFKKTINKLCYATIGLSSLLIASSIATFVLLQKIQ